MCFNPVRRLASKSCPHPQHHHHQSLHPHPHRSGVHLVKPKLMPSDPPSPKSMPSDPPNPKSKPSHPPNPKQKRPMVNRPWRQCGQSMPRVPSIQIVTRQVASNRQPTFCWQFCCQTPETIPCQSVAKETSCDQTIHATRRLSCGATPCD